MHQLYELNLSPHEIQKKLVSANIYLGSAPILEALRQGADVVITGRVADPSLFVAPLLYEFGWQSNDWNRVGRAVMLGHLMECGCQISGGYYADPGYKDVENLARLGYPILEVYEDERAYITKVPGSGGEVSVGTCKEQLLYEVRDPSSLITPDAVSDLTDVRFEQVEPNRVQVLGGKGRLPPDRLRVLLCVQEGYIGEGEISYGGPGADERARLAAACVREWLESEDGQLSELRIDLIGVNHLYQEASLSLIESAAGNSIARQWARGRAESCGKSGRRGGKPISQRPRRRRWGTKSCSGSNANVYSLYRPGTLSKHRLNYSRRIKYAHTRHGTHIKFKPSEQILVAFASTK